MKIIATVEARMTSSRLPGKVMLPANNKPMIEHLINRLKNVQSVEEIIVATTINETDQILVDFLESKNVKVYRGSEENVMLRVIEAASSVNADIIVEITGDCPVIDPMIIEQTIQMFLHNKCDYCSNVQVRSYPIGMDTQVFKLETLKKSYSMTELPLDREHVTRHIRLNPDMFSQLNLISASDLYFPDLGLTLDEENDYLLLKKIIEYFGEENPFFNCYDVINLLKNIHPEWINLNKDVQRKGLNK